VKNCLVIGGGSKFGLELANQFTSCDVNAYTITSKPAVNDTVLTVDWNTCNIANFEKFLKKLPVIDFVVFNQNSPALTDSCLKFKQDHIFEIWKRSKQWSQSHFVNCILPLYILQTLASNDTINPNGCVTWILSRSMFFNNTNAPVDYAGQKYQNYLMLQKLAQNNTQQFIGICPGQLTEQNYNAKSKLLVDFLQIGKKSTGKFYVINNNSIEENK
jgi:NAD(P)-dependent dehydrogenase (short-subunit alcohol dehydrogenase family)